ncbi:hypothetical protein HZB02_07605 [Candidatus Woesearchaeota archaeon]|nr:hypothetical protein [Candidatus Woesearchaeota archaeon]
MAKSVALLLPPGGFPGGAMLVGGLVGLEEMLANDEPFPQLFTLKSGCSAGSVVAASLHFGMTPRQMKAALVGGNSFSIDPSEYLSLDFDELFRLGYRNLRRLPSLMNKLEHFYQRPISTLAHAIDSLSDGFIESSYLERYLEGLAEYASHHGMYSGTIDYTDQEGTPKLRILASRLKSVQNGFGKKDQDSLVIFGETPGFEHYHIGQAVRASSSIPGLVTPVRFCRTEPTFFSQAFPFRYYAEHRDENTIEMLCDGGIDRSIGFKRFLDQGYFAVYFSVMEPYQGSKPLWGIVNNLSNAFNHLVSSRLTLALEHLPAEYHQSLVGFHIGEGFFSNLLRPDQNATAYKHGYLQFLHQLIAHYDAIAEKLSSTDLHLEPVEYARQLRTDASAILAEQFLHKGLYVPSDAQKQTPLPLLHFIPHYLRMLEKVAFGGTSTYFIPPVKKHVEP